ncbi:hypothetical protein GN958_ATG18965, partial [Phytophthora infestans]
YKVEDEGYSGLIADDVDFVEITSRAIVRHNTAKLKKTVWGKLTSFFSVSDVNFVYPAPTNSRSLRIKKPMCLRLEALSCVHGGMYEEEEFDSLFATVSTPMRERRATPSQRSGNRKRSVRSPTENTPNKNK